MLLATDGVIPAQEAGLIVIIASLALTLGWFIYLLR